MDFSRIVFVVAYVATLCCYFFSETSGKMKYRAPNKIILASLFLAYALVAFFLRSDLRSYHLLFMVAIFLAWFGDVYLLWDFSRGGDLFLCSNICFFVYELVLAGDAGLSFGDFWWFILVFAALWGSMVFLAATKRIDFGKSRFPMLLYLASVTLHGSLGLALACNASRASLPAVKLVLLGLGLGLFLASDYFLTLHKFVFTKSKAILRLNSGTYFVGLLLVVLSMSY